MLISGEPDFPFCLFRVNEPWTRCWDYGDNEVLMPQNSSDKEDWENYLKCLLKFLDKRYITSNDKLIFIIL